MTAAGEVVEGEWENDLPHGAVSWSWPDGGLFQGDMHEGHSEGEGCYTFSDGRKFTGKFGAKIHHGAPSSGFAIAIAHMSRGTLEMPKEDKVWAGIFHYCLLRSETTGDLNARPTCVTPVRPPRAMDRSTS